MQDLEVARVALVSVHTSPLDQAGTGDGGGLNVYVREVAARLGARGVEVDVFTRRTAPDQPSEVTVAPGVHVHALDAGPVRPVPKEQVATHLCAFVLALQRHPAAGSHDVLHTHYWLSGWVGRRLARRWGTPLVQTFHTLGTLKNATLAPGDVPEPPLRLAAEERVARDADRILALTAGEARLLRRTYGLAAEQVTVVPAGVDLQRFRPALVPSGASSGLASVPGVSLPGVSLAAVPSSATVRGVRRAPQLLFVGRLQPLKGPDVAVRILAEVRRTVPDARLRIVGGASGTGRGSCGPDELHALAAELGTADALTIEPAVDQDELVARYHAADVLVAPSRSETFGLVALEAQACGVPVVAADVPGLEAVVGAGGTLVAGHDPAEHAAAVVAYLTDPSRAAAASRAGIATARTASWDHTVDRLLDVYGEVVARSADDDPAHPVVGAASGVAG